MKDVCIVLFGRSEGKKGAKPKPHQGLEIKKMAPSADNVLKIEKTRADLPQRLTKNERHLNTPADALN